MKRIVAWVMVRVYGVRGALKPPLGGCRWYGMRRAWWKVADALYRWCGVPARWERWYTKGGV